MEAEIGLHVQTRLQAPQPTLSHDALQLAPPATPRSGPRNLTRSSFGTIAAELEELCLELDIINMMESLSFSETKSGA